MDHDDIQATRDAIRKLPPYCFAHHPISQLTVKVERGVTGYTPLDTFEDPAILNASLGISKAQAEAMLAGSMFGWFTRAADPDSYDENGVARSASRLRRRSRGSCCLSCGAPLAGKAATHQCLST